MANVENRYDSLTILRSPIRTQLLQAIEDVKKYIRDKGLIVTGGTAIDFAMRLMGDKIYDDDTLTFPDLDVYSPNHAEDAYTLADILYKRGYSNGSYGNNTYNIDAIVGLHIQTFRVRLYYQVLADITYVPNALSDKMSTLVYDNMKIIHPWWQYMNLHQSLAMPLKDPPLEPLFSRLKKDINRFSLLYKYYPINVKPTSDGVQKIGLTDIGDHILHGFAAYAAIYTIFATILPGNILGLKPLEIGSNYVYIPANVKPVVELVVESIPSTYDTKYNTFLDYDLPSYVVSENVTHHYLERSLLPCSLININDKEDGPGFNFKVVNILFLLTYMLLKYHQENENRIYLEYYSSLLEIITRIGLYVKSTKITEQDKIKIITESPFFIPQTTYGKINLSYGYEWGLLSTKQQLAQLLGETPTAIPLRPRNYHPDKKGEHPKFNPADSPYFAIDGLPETPLITLAPT